MTSITASSVTIKLTTFKPVNGKRASLDDLVAAVLRGVFHGDDDLLRAGHEIHRAAHALDHLPRNHPVGEVALFIDLQRAEHGQVDVPAADHRK